MGPDLSSVKTVGDVGTARAIKVKLEKAGIYAEIQKAPGSKYGLGLATEYSILVPAELLPKTLNLINT